MSARTTTPLSDTREAPNYSIADAAQYLRLPRSTLANWVSAGGLIKPAQTTPRLLSFNNLVEAFVLSAIRKEHHVTMPRTRKALSYVARKLKTHRPLITTQFKSDGVDLFIEQYGALLNVSRGGQLVMKETIEGHLTRIEWDSSGLALRLYPLARAEPNSQPKAIVIDPAMSFGRPVLSGTGIRTEVIAERYRAGESAAELATDYAVELELIEDAVRMGMDLGAAA